MSEYCFLRFMDILYEMSLWLVHQLPDTQFCDFDEKKKCQRYLYLTAGSIHNARSNLYDKYESREKDSEVMNAILAAASEALEYVER